MLKLDLVQIPAYPSSWGPLPDRMRFLHPDAARALARLIEAGGFPLLDSVFRTPAGSLKARKTKKGVMPPGYSAHNFGLAIDPNTDDMDTADYRKLVDACRAAGFECYRPNYSRGAEQWHFTYAASGPGSRAIERVIQNYYGAQLAAFARDVSEQQRALASLDFYDGKIDGRAGPLTKAGLAAFASQWGVSGPVAVARVLAVVTAERVGAVA